MMVRFAEEKDLPQVNELRRMVSALHAQNRPDRFRPGFPPELENMIYDFYRREGTCVVVAERDGQICGMACVEYIDRPGSAYMEPRKYYYIQEFGVSEAFQRQGVGKELFAFLQRDAREKGFASIELDVWEFNEAALKFYESVGFHPYRRLLELPL